MTMLRAGAAAAWALAGAASAPSALAQYRDPLVVCEVRDYNLALDLEMPLKRDGSGTPADDGMRGRLQILHQKVANERRDWSLDKRRPTQFWLVGNDLKLRLMLGLGEELIDLVIEARRKGEDDSDYAGTFRLNTAEGVRVTGRIGCAVG